MKLVTAQTIVLSRTNYSEADKIATLLTNDGKKISIIAKGVRKPKSKLASALEVFSIADITYIEGKSQLHTLRSAKISRQNGNIINDYESVQFAYAILKAFNIITVDEVDPRYFDILKQALVGLDEYIDRNVVLVWLWVNVVRLHGSGLQLQSQTDGQKFSEQQNYNFNFDNAGFLADEKGSYKAEHIKVLKIASSNNLKVLAKVKNANIYCSELLTEINQFVEIHIGQI